MSSLTALSFNEAAKAVKGCLMSGVVPFLRGQPGIGKSAIAAAIAKDANLNLIDIRLSQMDPVDMTGYPIKVGEFADYLPFKHFPLEGDAIPDGTNGWLIMMDELTAANKTLQAAAYKLIYDRKVGQKPLHSACYIMAAGNNVEDRAVAFNMSTALRSRLIHLNVGVNSKEFVGYTIQEGFSPIISAFLAWKPEMVNTFNPEEKNNHTFACNRTWEFADKIVSKAHGGTIKSEHLAVLAGALSLPVASELIDFANCWDKLPTESQMLKKPLEVQIPLEAGLRFALASKIGSMIGEGNAKPLLQLVGRMPATSAVISIRMFVQKIKKGNTPVNFEKFPEVKQFIFDNATVWGGYDD